MGGVLGTVALDGGCLGTRVFAVSGVNGDPFLSFSRITDQRYEKVPYFVFGDFNFRLDSKQVIEVRLFFSVTLLKVHVKVCLQIIRAHLCSNIP